MEFFDLKLEKILQDIEISMARALIGLSQGEIKSLADNLVIAFATRVIGLVVGGICYAVMVIRTRWYRQDLSDLEYAVDLLRGRRDETA